MKVQQMKTAMSAAWLELEVEAAMHGEELTERDREMWILGFSDGVLAETFDVLKKIASAEYKCPEKK